MLRLIRFAMLLVIGLAIWLAAVGLRRKSYRHLVASMALLLLLAAAFPLMIWLDRPTVVTLPPVAEAQAMARDARDILTQIQPSAFDDVAVCLRYLKTLMAYYNKYPRRYVKQKAKGEVFLAKWRNYKPETESQRHYCVDEKPLNGFVLNGQADLLIAIGRH